MNDACVLPSQRASSYQATTKPKEDSPPVLERIMALLDTIYHTGESHGAALRSLYSTTKHERDSTHNAEVGRGGSREGFFAKGGSCSPGARDTAAGSGSSAGAGAGDGSGRDDDWIQLMMNSLDNKMDELKKNEQRASELYAKYRKDVEASSARVSARQRKDDETTWEDIVQAQKEKPGSSGFDGRPMTLMDLFDRLVYDAGDVVASLPILGRSRKLSNEEVNEYYTSSEYRPISIEEQNGFDKSWRVRFEDLVRTTNGEEMTNPEEAKALERMPSKEFWNYYKNREEVESSPWRRLQQTIAERPEQSAASAVVSQRQWQSQWQSSETDAASHADVVQSVFRSTTTHTEADGSVVTKTVVKKLFADGHEENTETVDNQAAQQRKLAEPRVRRDKANTHVSKPGKALPQQETGKRGWFWSS